jgi:hypothetical protein
MIITLTDYLMDRDRLYPQEYSIGIKANAELTVAAVNVLLKRLEASGVKLENHPVTRTIISSGWRPPQINGQVKNAAIRSKHMTGQACDLYDPEGVIDDWLMDNLPADRSLGLFMEHPSATKGWSHVQIVPPASGKVCFYP